MGSPAPGSPSTGSLDPNMRTLGRQDTRMEQTRRNFIGTSIAAAAAAALPINALASTDTGPVATPENASEAEIGQASNAKVKDLAADLAKDTGPLTTNIGMPYATDQNSLKAGPRGPVLLEDFVLREKIQHFDHERIPERIVHARGAAAHGTFQLYESLESLTKAKVLTDTSLKTPVFVRFSTVAGFRGSADTVRDVRGFAVKFYTPEGNWDIVGNNIPVFFIQDAIKFPDMVHAVKPEPHNEIPQASSAHDTFYDFISLTPESMHIIMWLMSDRALPRSYSTMEGFGVHAFRLVNAKGESHFVKFHWKPVLGVHSLVFDEAQLIAGRDPDFHRRDLWEAMERGDAFEYELALQVIPEADENKFDFDILDATKIWPEEIAPLRRVGKLTLDRNPDNYFSETEQVAFNTTNVVPGIDFSDDPLLQGRNFSYLDTQLSRLGSPNFTELPINRPVCPFHNNQRDAHMRHTINKGRVSYAPASLDGHSPEETINSKGFMTFKSGVSGPKVRERSHTFDDHYGQASLFWNSMSPVEKEHIVKALQFELSKVETRAVRQRMLSHLAKVNATMAAQIGAAVGESHPDVKPSGSADSVSETQALAAATTKTTASGGVQSSKALSQADQPTSAKGRKVAILVDAGTDKGQVDAAKSAVKAAGAHADVVGPYLGAMEATKTYANSSSVLYDAVVVPASASLAANGDAKAWVAQSYKHAKAIAALGDGEAVLKAALPEGASMGALGVVTDLKAFVAAIPNRHWGRKALDRVAA